MKLINLYSRYIIFMLAVAFFSLAPASVLAVPNFMPVDEVKAGMHGIAKTVVSGSKIEEFGVEVLGIMKNKGPAGDLILVKAYGDVIERTGGIAQGMSGSPVYIDGRLIGAIAYGWGLTDHKTGMVTPIADMLKLWEMPDDLRKPEIAKKEPEKETKKIEEPVVSKDGLQAEKDADTDGGTDNRAEDIIDETSDEFLKDEKSISLTASGFSDRAVAMLKKELAPYNVSVTESGGDFTGDTEIAYKIPEPGSMVGISLIRGDLNLSSIGTVTYVEDGKILAFGHPFMKRGNSNYFLTDASVYTTLQGIENSFKIGSTGPAIGLVNQDRGAGISGVLGVFPRIVPLRISVNDKTMGVTKNLSVQVAHDEGLSPILAAVTIFNAIEKTSDRTGSGTARVKFDISASGMPLTQLSRENMFYTSGSISELAIAEIFEAMAILTGNKYNPVNIIDVKVDVEVESERRTASIMEARPEKLTVKPGETVEVAVKLKPFRQEPISRKAKFTVPKDQPPGDMMVSVRGGGVVSLSQLLSKRQENSGNDEENLIKLLMLSRPRPKTFEAALKDLTDRDRYNDIVLEIVNIDNNAQSGKPATASSSESDGIVTERIEKAPEEPIPPKELDNESNNSNAKIGTLKDALNSENQRKFNIATDHIIDGETQFIVNIAG